MFNMTNEELLERKKGLLEEKNRISNELEMIERELMERGLSKYIWVSVYTEM